MTKKIMIGALLCCAGFTGGTQAADPRPADMLGNTCAGCHGTLGASAGEAMPTVGGLDKAYLEYVMTGFKDGSRFSTIMGRIARGYTDLEIKSIAQYFADRPWVNTTAKTKSDLVNEGKAIAESQCNTCHGDEGKANRGDVPRLAGQWPHYLYNQLVQFHTIGNDLPQPLVMRNMVQKLNDNELHALAHYYASRK